CNPGGWQIRPGTLLFVSTAPGDALRAARRLVERSAIASSATLSWQLPYIDDQLPVNPYDEAALISAIDEYVGKHRIAGVVTFDERAVVATAALRTRLNLSGNTRESAYAARNKYIMRSRFADGGLSVPEFAVARALTEAMRLAEKQLTFPLVLKP